MKACFPYSLINQIKTAFPINMQLAVHPVHPEYDSPVSCEGENVTSEGLEGHMMYDRSRMFCGSKHRNSPSSFATWEGDETVFVAEIVTELWY